MTHALPPSLHNIHCHAQCDLPEWQRGELRQERATRRGRPSIPLVNRFWSKVNHTATCWLWTSNRHRNGYGQIAFSRHGAARQRWAWAHRIAYELTFGPIPAGQLVLHHCDTPLCVNPAHLFLGSHSDNMADALAKGRLTGRPRRSAGAVTVG